MINLQLHDNVRHVSTERRGVGGCAECVVERMTLMRCGGAQWTSRIQRSEGLALAAPWVVLGAIGVCGAAGHIYNSLACKYRRNKCQGMR